MEGGRSYKADHPNAIYFLYSVYMQKVVLGPSARIFLAIGTSQLRDRGCLHGGRKILTLGRS